MRSLTLISSLLLMSFMLSACGGKSDSEQKVSTINGTITIASNTLRDGDLNDINTPFIENSSPETAQEIPNIVTIQGFATATETIQLGGASDDRFYLSVDENDYYLTHLQAGQIIQLQVVNYDPFTTDSIYSGDLDLYLINLDSGDSLSSFGTEEFETLIAPETGLYYINVNAYSDASRYVLTLRQPGAAEVAQTNSALFQVSQGDFIANELIIQFNDTFQSASANDEFNNIQTSHPGKTRATLAKLNDTRASQFAFQSANTGSGMLSLASHYPETYEKLMTIHKMKSLARSPKVKQVSLNFLRRPMRVPSDPFYPLQWHYPAMNLPQAWDITTGSPESGSVVVAVVDTGIVSTHPDLSNKLVEGYDFIRESENSRDAEPGIDNNPEDPGDSTDLGSSSWHGTHVAGTIAAESDNNTGVAGVSWGAKIMPLRVLGQFGGSTYDIMQAIRFAAGLENDSGTLPAQTADIINLSLGGAGASQIEAALYKQVHDQGIIIVAAAGNENSSIAAYPASYDGVISVSAIDFNKQRAPYSNFGQHVDIAAPGGDMTKDANRDGRPDGVLSTFLDDSTGIRKPIYGQLQGTSMAAPHVSGMFALMKAVHPSLTASDVDILLASGELTDPAGANGRDDIFGNGLANALKAVQAASAIANGGSLPEVPPILQASPSSLSFSPAKLTSTLNISNQGGGSPSLISVTNNNSWLSITEINQTSQNILASYTLQVDPSNLSDGFYSGTVEFHFDSAPTLNVNINLTVGIEDTDGHLATVFALLYDVEQNTVIDEVQAIEKTSGTVGFSFTNVPKSRYLIFSGTDIDNDLFICQLAEGCAIYPPSSQISPIDTNSPSTFNIEMTANILSSQDIANSSASSQITSKKVMRLQEESKFKRTHANQE